MHYHWSHVKSQMQRMCKKPEKLTYKNPRVKSFHHLHVSLSNTLTIQKTIQIQISFLPWGIFDGENSFDMPLLS